MGCGAEAILGVEALQEGVGRILTGKVGVAVVQAVEVMVGGMPPILLTMDPTLTLSMDIAELMARAGMGLGL